jgi:hypothetical protein
VVTPEETQTSNTSKPKHVKTRNGYQIVASDGVIAGFCQARKYLDSAIAIAALHWPDDEALALAGAPHFRFDRQDNGIEIGPLAPFPTISVGRL